MSVIWIVEKADPNGRTASRALVGDFPVRLFASIDTFQKLLRINRRNMPDILVIDEEACDWSQQRLRDSLSYYMPQVPCVFLCKNLPTEKIEGIFPTSVLREGADYRNLFLTSFYV